MKPAILGMQEVVYYHFMPWVNRMCHWHCFLLINAENENLPRLQKKQKVAKGQLISKGLVGILNSSKKWMKFFDQQYYDPRIRA